MSINYRDSKIIPSFPQDCNRTGRKIAEDLRMKEQQSDRKIVSFPPKPARKKAVA
jgi:hypothetical protein